MSEPAFDPDDFFAMWARVGDVIGQIRAFRRAWAPSQPRSPRLPTDDAQEGYDFAKELVRVLAVDAAPRTKMEAELQGARRSAVGMIAYIETGVDSVAHPADSRLRRAVLSDPPSHPEADRRDLASASGLADQIAARDPRMTNHPNHLLVDWRGR